MAHILIIDDEPAVLMLFGKFLTRHGYDVETAADGKEGLRAFARQKPDLIITDIMMPEMDGLELLMTLRKQAADIPVIAISGGMKGTTISFLPHAEQFGARRAFHKPVDLEELLNAVRELLGETHA